MTLAENKQQETKKDGKASAPVKKKAKKSVAVGIIHVQNTFNNTIICVTDLNGNVLAWASAGGMNFRGAKKSTPYASQIVASHVCEAVAKIGFKEAKVVVKGPGFGRESAIRAIAKSGIRITQIKDVTGVPHNGCRPRKQRRI